MGITLGARLIPTRLPRLNAGVADLPFFKGRLQSSLYRFELLRPLEKTDRKPQRDQHQKMPKAISSLRRGNQCASRTP